MTHSATPHATAFRRIENDTGIWWACTVCNDVKFVPPGRRSDEPPWQRLADWALRHHHGKHAPTEASHATS